jgi:hypothetical protein
MVRPIWIALVSPERRRADGRIPRPSLRVRHARTSL